jgi:hypothetical protein
MPDFGNPVICASTCATSIVSSPQRGSQTLRERDAALLARSIQENARTRQRNAHTRQIIVTAAGCGLPEQAEQ